MGMETPTHRLFPGLYSMQPPHSVNNMVCAHIIAVWNCRSATGKCETLPQAGQVVYACQAYLSAGTSREPIVSFSTLTADFEAVDNALEPADEYTHLTVSVLACPLLSTAYTAALAHCADPLLATVT